eukprot:tig00000802_g4304.t1
MSSAETVLFSHEPVEVDAPNVRYTPDEIVSTYDYSSTEAKIVGGKLSVRPLTRKYTFRTKRRVPRLGCMLVGWGGNNGSTMTAAVVANREKISWKIRTGTDHPDYLGSLTQASVVRIGCHEGKDVFVPMRNLLPMVDPNDLVLGGWDISKMNLHASLERAGVLEPDLRRVHRREPGRPRGQRDRGTKQQQLERVRADIREFKKAKGLDKVIVMWTANSERYSEIKAGLNDTADNLLAAIARDEKEVSPSTVYAVASVLEGCTYINGAPQNTLVPGALELATRHKVFVAGDDFKSGQTKMKSVLVDYFVSAGIKVETMVTYNHLGNNDMKQLTDKVMWRPKEASKSRVIEDIVDSNRLLYAPGERPDHVVVVKYVPFLGDSKRDVSEYTSRVFMGGHHTMIMHNECLDSLLCAPLMVDLLVLGELLERIAWRTEEMPEFERFHPIVSAFGYYMKIPLVPQGTQVVNALARQRACIENMLRACIGLPPENSMLLENKCIRP